MGSALYLAPSAPVPTYDKPLSWFRADLRTDRRNADSFEIGARARDYLPLSSSASLSSSPAHDKDEMAQVVDGPAWRSRPVAGLARPWSARSRALRPGLRGLEKTAEHQDRVQADTSPSTDVYERRGRRGVPASVAGPPCCVSSGVEERRTGALRREGVGAAGRQAVEGGAHSQAPDT
ncbi:unnamed protein product [Peniophora sp. CBMAI 1063]|nr:unnamed protein product [Peniophora sp. CBMAI 1063]